MSNILKDSQMNINRSDRVENGREKPTEGGNNLNPGVKNIPRSNSAFESTFNVSEPSIFHDEMNKQNTKSEDDYGKTYNQKPLDLSSLKSELNSSCSEQKNFINYFSLPKFGICEKASQTNLTGRDIDDLEYFQKELAVFRSDLMAYVFKSKSNDLIRKLFPHLDEKKYLGSGQARERQGDLSLSINEPIRQENFIHIKRATDCELNLNLQSKKEKSFGRSGNFGHLGAFGNINTNTNQSSSFSEKITENCQKPIKPSFQTNPYTPQGFPHIHLKTKQHKGGRKKKKLEDEPMKESSRFSNSNPQFQRENRESQESNDLIKEAKQLGETKEMKNVDFLKSLEKEINSSQPISKSSASVSQSSSKNFNEEFDIAGIINDIKNSSKKMPPQIRKVEPFNLSNNNFSENKGEILLSGNTSHPNHDALEKVSSNLNKQFNTTSFLKQKKLFPARKFDAYGFFKAEYASFHKNLPDDELEKMCKKEWNSLDKGMKKIYNMNAERERKNHKLKKKTLMREEMMRRDTKGDDIK